MSQMDIKRKPCDIRTRENHLFLNISSTSIDTFVPSLYQCVETRSKEVSWLLSQLLPHGRFSLSFLERISRPSCEPLYATNTSRRKQETFLYECPMHWVIVPTKKNAQQNVTFRWYTPQRRSLFWLLKPASEHAHARLLPRLSWSWAVLLPSDTYRKPNMPIVAVLLPFVTYLLAFPHIYMKTN
jgi:hypothetical protein